MSVTISKLQHISCITALHIHPPHQPNRLLAASGSTLHVYNYPSLQLHASHQWRPHAHRIHGITSLGDLICIWGGRYVQLLLLTATTVTPYSKPLRLKDHIWNATCLTCPPTCPFSSSASPPACRLILGLSHNSVAICTVPLPSHDVVLRVALRVEEEVACSVRPLLYSVSFHGACLHDLHVVAGTVFSSIIVWTAHPTSRITHTLTGHSGVIFSTTCISASDLPSSSTSSSSSSAASVVPASSFLVHSVSDDRTVRSFSVHSDDSWQLLHTCWGHEARVFRLVATALGSIISGGEDDTVRVWSAGQEAAIWRERGRKGGVWAVAVDESSGRVIAGLGDGRVRVMDFSGVLCAQMPQQQTLSGRTRPAPLSSQLQCTRQWELGAFTTADDAPPTVNLPLPSTKRQAVVAVEPSDGDADDSKQAAQNREAEYCRAMTHYSSNELLMATSTGRILHLALPLSNDLPTTQQPITRLLFRYPAHLSISTLSISSDGRFVAAGDSRGSLLLLSLISQSAGPSTECWCHRTAAYTTAISFMQFFALLSSTYLMTADALGEVRWWRVDAGEQQPTVELCEMSSFRLPLRTHVTCALVSDSSPLEDTDEHGAAKDESEVDEQETSSRATEHRLVCGDSKGTVYVYQMLLSLVSLTVYASCRLSTVHNSVSALQSLSSSRLLSVGKDATLLSYSLQQSTEPPSALDAAWITKHNTAVPNSSPPPPARRYVLLITSTTRVGIAQLYGMLPSPTAVSSSRPLVYGFSSTELKVYHSERQVQLMAVACGGSKRPYVCFLSSSSAADCPALHFLYTAHSAGACTLSHHRLTLQSAVTHSDSVGDACHTRLTTAVSIATLHSDNQLTRLLLTTGEDSLFKVWLLSSDPASARVKLLHTVNDHPETVRALAVIDGGDGSVYAFSGGGRDCLYAYHLRRREDEQQATDGAVDVIRSGQVGGANVKMKGKTWLRREQPKSDGSELDVMDVRILSVVALIDPRSTAARFCCTVVVGDSVGRLRFYHYSAAAASFDLIASSTSHARPILCMGTCGTVMLSGDTVGRVRVWDVSTPATPHELAMLQLHQAGVNCCALVAVSSTSYRLLTGGDDGCIGVVIFSLLPAFAVVSRVVHPFMHNSAIRCMRVRESDGLLVTSGYDQLLRFWRLGEAGAALLRIGQCALELADISGLGLEGDFVAVVGAGLSILRAHI